MQQKALFGSIDDQWKILTEQKQQNELQCTKLSSFLCIIIAIMDVNLPFSSTYHTHFWRKGRWGGEQQ